MLTFNDVLIITYGLGSSCIVRNQRLTIKFFHQHLGFDQMIQVKWPSIHLTEFYFIAISFPRLYCNIINHTILYLKLYPKAHGGLQIFINRLESEVEACRKEQPYEIRPPSTSASSHGSLEDNPESESDMEVDGALTNSMSIPVITEPVSGITCLPQRAALLKSMLNFLKKAIQDTSFSDSIR